MSKKRKRELGAPEWRESRTTKRQDELWFKDQILATIRWAGCFSKRASARSPEGSWIFDRPRLLSKDVEVYLPGSDSPIAVYREGWLGGGDLEFADGHTFHWGCTDFWQSKWQFTDVSGQPVVRFFDSSGFFERKAIVKINSSALSPSERDLLTMLGRYLMILRVDDTVVVTAASTAAVF